MARFFIDRPVFAMVISLVISIAGALSITSLPIAQFPQISPPTVSVEITYPGANATTVAEAIASIVEQEVNGAEGMLYFSSRSSSDGRYTLTCTFEVGTDLDIATVDVNNRVNKASARLPSEAINQGIKVTKKSPDMLMAISLFSEGGVYDDIFVSNYATTQIVDPIARTDGVGSTQIVGQRDYSMRLWLRPDRLAGLGLTATDLARVVEEQSKLVPTGSVGQPPAAKGTEFQLAVDAKTRLSTPEQFENLIVRTLPDGSVLRMKEVARVELGAQNYSSFGRIDGSPAVVLLVYQRPGANALATAEAVRSLLADQLAPAMPEGIEYEITLDTTMFVTAAIEEVISTVVEAFVLVLAVVYLFLGSFRATVIPMLAVPVSLLGTFAFFVVFGFSINTINLFGIILAIGLVVDDAIVVVEAVEVHIARGLSPRDATVKAMEEVTGPVIATTLVLCATFVPVAFMGGITGEIYRQFALTLSISVALSSIVALTLTPALCRLMLKPRGKPRGPISKGLALFSRALDASTRGYGAVVSALVRKSVLGLVAVGAVMFGISDLGKRLSTGFVPSEDLGYLFSLAILPDGASLERTEQVASRFEEFARQVPGVRRIVSLGGLNLLTGTYDSNAASFIAVLDPWDERESRERSVTSILQAFQRELASYPEAVGFAFNPPPIPGIGTSGGLQLEVQARQGQSLDELYDVAQSFSAAAMKRPEIGAMFSSFRPNVPQIELFVDRDRAKIIGVPISDVFQSLQIFLGGLTVEDFSAFGRTYRVTMQAEPSFRSSPQSIGEIYVRSPDDVMVPLATLVELSPITGPNVIFRYNMFPCSEFTIAPAPGRTGGDVIAAIGELEATDLPEGFGLEWTAIAYQQIRSAGGQSLILGLAIVFVFLFLAAQYESWSIPLSVLLGLPTAILGAFAATWMRSLSIDVYVQIGLVMLIGMAAKNAILIVEFSKLRREEGEGVIDAAIEGSKLRFRPILMTAISFLLGVLPLVLAAGAGAASRVSLGTAVFGGMLVATAIGVFLIPMLDVVVQLVVRRLFGEPKTSRQPAPTPPAAASEGGAA
ncbi:MAG: efflux RND transporter permease subunit [Phycisphaerales bacterium]